MLVDVYKKEVEELYKTSIVQQTAFWSIVKQKIGQDSIAMNFKSRKTSLYTDVSCDATLQSDVLVILQNVNRFESVAYVPYGPELEPDNEFQGAFLEELSECLRSYLPQSCFMVRYDLGWETFWAKEGLTDAPSLKSQEMRLNFNTVHWNLRKSETNVLPTNTLFLNLALDLNTILDRMKPKTRYNIKLAQKKGVTVRIADMKDLAIWYDLYTETAHRNGLYLNDIKYFEAILDIKADSTKSPAEVCYLIAEYEGVPLAAMFLIISGNRGSYLYGASSSKNRQVMATYALQWYAIRLSKEKGCKEYDMFGIAPSNDASHPLYGLYQFKKGFGGEVLRRLGCWDYPYDEEKYNVFKSREILGQGYHLQRS